MARTDETTPLPRRLGVPDAVTLGLGAMIGAGVFAAFAPATRAADGGRRGTGRGGAVGAALYAARRARA